MRMKPLFLLTLSVSLIGLSACQPKEAVTEAETPAPAVEEIVEAVAPMTLADAIAHPRRAEDTARDQFRKMATTQQLAQVRMINGSIAEVPLPDLLQMFSHSRKTGVLMVHTDADVGKIFFEDGQVQFASINDEDSIPSEKAFYRIVTWEEGTFELYPLEDRPMRREIDAGLQGLLMDAMQQLDEIRRLTHVPSMRDTLQIISEPGVISPEVTEVFDLIGGNGLVESVLNHCSLSDLNALTIIDQYIESGHLVIAD